MSEQAFGSVALLMVDFSSTCFSSRTFHRPTWSFFRCWSVGSSRNWSSSVLFHIFRGWFWLRFVKLLVYISPCLLPEISDWLPWTAALEMPTMSQGWLIVCVDLFETPCPSVVSVTHNLFRVWNVGSDLPKPLLKQIRSIWFCRESFWILIDPFCISTIE